MYKKKHCSEFKEGHNHMKQTLCKQSHDLWEKQQPNGHQLFMITRKVHPNCKYFSTWHCTSYLHGKTHSKRSKNITWYKRLNCTLQHSTTTSLSPSLPPYCTHKQGCCVLTTASRVDIVSAWCGYGYTLHLYHHTRCGHGLWPWLMASAPTT